MYLRSGNAIETFQFPNTPAAFDNHTRHCAMKACRSLPRVSVSDPAVHDSADCRTHIHLKRMGVRQFEQIKTFSRRGLHLRIPGIDETASDSRPYELIRRSTFNCGPPKATGSGWKRMTASDVNGFRTVEYRSEKRGRFCKNVV
jgi:hypothetical protein